jgi:hypothetical protein
MVEQNRLLILSIIIFYTFVWIIPGQARDNKSSRRMALPAEIREAVIDIGKVHNYFWNNTSNYNGWEHYGFVMGHSFEPSMQWLEGGYEDNNYLNLAVTKIAAGSSIVQFNSLTSEDWQEWINEPEAVSPYDIYFSFTDELAGTWKKGIKASQTVHAWPEEYRNDFFILEYDIININSSNYQDCYLMFEVDADVSSAFPYSNYFTDDLTSFYLGTDSDGHIEHLSYMFDGDAPEIEGDDTGGEEMPKESTGYIGSRILDCPARVGEGPESANTQSGHHWWDWSSYPTEDEFYIMAQSQSFAADPGSPHNYRYLQSLGPFQLNSGDTVHVALAFGIGEGLEGLRQNLLWAYRLYWNNFMGPAAPEQPQPEIDCGDRWVKISWDGYASENSPDPLTGIQDFEGYRIYRSTDGFKWSTIATFDLKNHIGENTGLPIANDDGWYEFIDDEVTNGFVYYYAVTAFDQGSEGLDSLESAKQTDLYIEVGPRATDEQLNIDKIRVVPNPFVVKAPWDFTPTPDNPSEERLQFQNVPKGSKVTIFTLTGDLIIELYQHGDQGWIDWDLITRNRQKVVAGLYLYVVESTDGESHIGKFVIVR